MKLEHMAMKELLALHNSISDKLGGSKTFSTRSKLVATIERIAEAKSIDLAAFGQPKAAKVADTHAQPQTEAAKATDGLTEAEKPHGKGIGALARAILMDPTGYPHALVAVMVNAQIQGAAATAKSVRWYANDMRKRGVEVPPRQKGYPPEMDEQQSAEWLETVRVVEPVRSDD